MTEEVKSEPKKAEGRPVSWWPTNWTESEASTFEEFVKVNGAEMRRVFIKYGLIK